MWKWVVGNWERVFFSATGICLIGYSIFLITTDRVTNASIVFGLGFLSFIYANVSRFKKFKGLGFEAELWEDTKKEAEDLIQRLRNVVTIYSREAILRKVYSGRWSDGVDWESNWQLYNDLVAQHDILGQEIDFSDVKNTADSLFLGDMTSPLYSKIHRKLMEAQSESQKRISSEFGPTISDHEGYSRRLAQLHAIPREIKDPYGVSKTENLAQKVLALWSDAKAAFKRDFDIDIDIEEAVLERLEGISTLYANRPVKVTPEIVSWADEKPEY